MKVTIDLPETAVCLHMVLVEHNDRYSSSAMYQIFPQTEQNVTFKSSIPEETEKGE